eukprot:CAMPEP_0172441710 /NCGR_PEP_ID=MMETSP1065-20121228/2204_1 /TAXON_ID=265537 /ORGANISM="Amphiprora paludosa, Strain CCMP125" /LENGTH=347 /DNA_ID=CAMNT_0013191187 /DNA_START=42 /DNA_END=1085 /DNA_ORIENTATION=+
MSNNNNNSTPLATTAPALVEAPQSAVTVVGGTAPATTTAAQATKIDLPTRLVLAALSGMGAATVCHPLDVVRVQMQTSSSFRNSYHAATSIYAQSGLVNGLYAGISAAYLRQWLYGSCRIGIYSYLLEGAQQQNLAAGRKKNDISFATKLGMGCTSGSIGSLVGTPSEVALVRMGADSKLPVAERRNYTSVVNCLTRIAKEEGVINLWRGAAPTVARATVLSACQLGVTSEAKEYLSDSGYFGVNGQWLGGYPMMFCATTLSSFCANLAANPFDVIKSRMQQMKTTPGVTPPYTSMMDCFIKSIKAEGPMVLYAGFTPAFLKLAPYTILSLTLADKLTKAWTGKEAL